MKIEMVIKLLFYRIRNQDVNIRSDFYQVLYNKERLNKMNFLTSYQRIRIRVRISVKFVYIYIYFLK